MSTRIHEISARIKLVVKLVYLNKQTKIPTTPPLQYQASGFRTPTNRWFARGSGAKILVPNQKIPEFAANSGILGFGTATKRSQAKAMNFAVKIRQPQNSRVRPELWNLPVQLFQLSAGSA